MEMGLKTQFQVRHAQKLKRHKKRKRLSGKKLDPNNFFYGKYYIGNCAVIADNNPVKEEKDVEEEASKKGKQAEAGRKVPTGKK